MSKILGNQKMAVFMGYTYYPHNYEQRLRYSNFRAGWKLREDADWSSKTNRLRFPFEKGVEDWYLCRSHTGLKYDTDYNWLMKVVDKIESLGYDFVTTRQGIQIWRYKKLDKTLPNDLIIDDDFLDDYVGELKRDAIWNSAVAFIDWYNKQNT